MSVSDFAVSPDQAEFGQSPGALFTGTRRLPRRTVDGQGPPTPAGTGIPRAARPQDTRPVSHAVRSARSGSRKQAIFARYGERGKVREESVRQVFSGSRPEEVKYCSRAWRAIVACSVGSVDRWRTPIATQQVSRRLLTCSGLRHGARQHPAQPSRVHWRRLPARPKP